LKLDLPAGEAIVWYWPTVSPRPLPILGGEWAAMIGKFVALEKSKKNGELYFLRARDQPPEWTETYLAPPPPLSRRREADRRALKCHVTF
jgi:hypothetical protein